MASSANPSLITSNASTPVTSHFAGSSRAYRHQLTVPVYLQTTNDELLPGPTADIVSQALQMTMRNDDML